MGDHSPAIQSKCAKTLNQSGTLTFRVLGQFHLGSRGQGAFVGTTSEVPKIEKGGGSYETRP